MNLKKSIITILEFESTKKENLVKIGDIFDLFYESTDLVKTETNTCICLTININKLSFLIAEKIAKHFSEIVGNKEPYVIFELIEDREEDIDSIFTFKLIKLWETE